MKSFKLARPAAAILMAAVLLASPIAVLAKKGEKNYRQGLQYEEKQQWEKAAQEFALALAISPSDTEYLLHYRRAVFNASQVFMQKGKALYEQGDYVGAYNAFRQAYGLDPVNDLAAQEMDHMLRLQREKEGAANPSKSSPANYRPGQGGANGVHPNGQADGVGPARAEQLQTIQYTGDLEGFIRKLADELELNVVFDQNFSQVKRNVNIRWKNMTPARALDYVFLSNGLFFQKLDRRTILVADQSKRPMYQQLVLRTFYLYNITPDDARTLLTGALPANAGRQPQFISNKSTNSITVRDTPENIRIIEQLLRSVDKDRAEVVMEVAIYEISHNDLMQIGNQVGTLPSDSAPSNLTALGGIQPSTVVSGRGAALLAGAASLHSPLGFLIPASTISLFQSKNNTRLLFSTQVHAFDDEKSSTRVGSKVPVQTASVYNGLINTGNNTGNNGGVNNALGSGYPVIQYEDVGLNLDFKPKVYPNQDVQVAMTIESKDVQAGANALTPVFTQRKIEGVARIPNGKTMMIASVAQDRQQDGRAGLPLLSFLPILGRLFTSPTKNNQQADIVITMTPRVLRAPEILPSDEESRPTGTMQTPQAESLEAMVDQADKEDQYARLRSLPTIQNVQVPNQQTAQQTTQQPAPEEATTFIPAPRALADVAANTTTANDAGASAAPAVNVSTDTEAPPPVARPAIISNSFVKPAASDAALNKTTTANAAPANLTAAAPAPAAVETKAATAVTDATNTTPAVSVSAPAESKAELLLFTDQQDIKVGERKRVMVFLRTDAPIGLATATLRFDPRTLAVRSVTQGVLSNDKAAAPVLTQSTDAEKGVLFLSVSPASGAQPLTGEGLLLVIEVEALATGDALLQFDADKLHLIATDGRTVRPKAADGRIKVIQ